MRAKFKPRGALACGFVETFARRLAGIAPRINIEGKRRIGALMSRGELKALSDFPRIVSSSRVSSPPPGRDNRLLHASCMFSYSYLPSSIFFSKGRRRYQSLARDNQRCLFRRLAMFLFSSPSPNASRSNLNDSLSSYFFLCLSSSRERLISLARYNERTVLHN